MWPGSNVSIEHSHPARESSKSLSLRRQWNNTILLNTDRRSMDVHICPCSPLSSCKFHWFIYWEMWCFPPKCPLLGSNFAPQLSHSKEKGSCVGPLWAASPVLLGFSCISFGLLHRFDKFLDFFFQGFVPPLNILPGALHVAEADFQGCRLLLFILQLFIEPHHLSPNIVIFFLKATRKERNEWKNWVLPLDSSFTLAHTLLCPFAFPHHKTHTQPVPLVYVPTPSWVFPRKLNSHSMSEPVLSFNTILWHLLYLLFMSFYVLCLLPNISL